MLNAAPVSPSRDVKCSSLRSLLQVLQPLMVLLLLKKVKATDVLELPSPHYVVKVSRSVADDLSLPVLTKSLETLFPALQRERRRKRPELSFPHRVTIPSKT